MTTMPMPPAGTTSDFDGTSHAPDAPSHRRSSACGTCGKYTLIALLENRPGVLNRAVSPETRPEVMQLCEVFRARIIDVARESVIVELTGDEAKLEGFVDLLRPLGIVEMVRTGLVAMGRGNHVLGRNGFESSWAEHRARVEAESAEAEASKVA